MPQQSQPQLGRHDDPGSVTFLHANAEEVSEIGRRIRRTTLEPSKTTVTRSDRD